MASVLPFKTFLGSIVIKAFSAGQLRLQQNEFYHIEHWQRSGACSLPDHRQTLTREYDIVGASFCGCFRASKLYDRPEDSAVS